MKAWKIVLRGQVVDTVFYDAAITAETVQRQLIDKDGFDPEIEVSPSRIPNWLDDENQEQDPFESDSDYYGDRGEENQEQDPFEDSDYYESLLDLALWQIRKDVASGDYNAIELLLCLVAPKDLQAFVSEFVSEY